MPQPPKKLRKQYLNNQYPNVVLRFEDGHEIVIKRGTGKTFDCYAGENIKLLAVFDPDARERILRETKGFDIILGDALRGATRGTDENKSEFRDHIDLLRDVAMDGNKFVCFLHHGGKDETKPFRGTSGIGDAAGHMFIVTNTTPDKRGPKRVHHEKLGNGRDLVDDFFIQLKRDGEDGNGPMRITFMTEEEAKKQAEAEPIEKEEWLDTKKKILKKLQSSAGISRNELYDAVKGNRATFDKVLKHLVEKLRYVENQGAATNHKYVITTAGQEWLDKGSRYARHTPGPNAPPRGSGSPCRGCRARTRARC